MFHSIPKTFCSFPKAFRSVLEAFRFVQTVHRYLGVVVCFRVCDVMGIVRSIYPTLLSHTAKRYLTPLVVGERNISALGARQP